MTSKRPTIRDVAEAAGVSVTTVSDAINDKGRVDPATRALVRETAATIGWTPQRSARALRSGRTGTIAFCLPPEPSGEASWLMSTDYYMQLAAACASAAMDADRRLLLARGPRDLDELESLDIDGAIVVDPTEADPTLRVFESANVAVVTIDRDLANESDWWVSADNRDSISILLQHLVDKGATTVGLLTCETRWSWFQDALDTYLEWCDARGAEPLVENVPIDTPGESSAAVIERLVQTGSLPDAVIGLPYGSALGVIRAATQAGIDIPERLMVASGVDGHAFIASNPPVTAMDLMPAEVASAAVKLLGERIDGKEGSGPVMTSTRLKVRGSTEIQ